METKSNKDDNIQLFKPQKGTFRSKQINLGFDITGAKIS
jgi:hypothetical protein